VHEPVAIILAVFGDSLVHTSDYSLRSRRLYSSKTNVDYSRRKRPQIVAVSEDYSRRFRRVAGVGEALDRKEKRHAELFGRFYVCLVGFRIIKLVL